MRDYFVTHPRLNKTAVIHAPSTEKARTTFLDWLERNGMISRRDRQSWRRDMVAERIEDPNVYSDVELWYGYEEEPSIHRFPEKGITEEEGRLAAGELPEEVYYPKLTEEGERLASGEPPEEVYFPEEPEVGRRRLSPIQERALRGYI